LGGKQEYFRKNALLYSISAGHGIKHLFSTSVSVLIPFIKEGLLLTGVQIGALATSHSIAGALVNVPSGILSDLFKKKVGIIIGFSALFLGIGYLILFFLSKENWIVLGFIAFILFGGGASLWHPPAFAVLSTRYPDRKAFALGVHLSAASAGNTLGPVMVGVLLGGGIYGIYSAGMDWRNLSILISVMCFTLAIVIFIFSPKITIKGKKTVNVRNYFSDAYKSLKKIEVIVMILLHAVRSAVHSGFTVYLLIYLKEYLNLSPVAIGIHFSLIGLSGVLFTPIWGAFSDRVGRLPVITLGMILTGIFIYLIRFGSSGWSLIILLLLLGCVLFAIVPVISAAAIDYTIKGTEGTSVSLLFSGGAILGSLSPLISGYFYDSFGFNAVLTFTSVLALLGTVISLIAWNRFK